MNISNIENGEQLTFDINGNVAFVNAIRRTILSQIPCVCFITSPEKDNNLIIEKNTCGLNNEIIKQRFSNIPVYLKEHDEMILSNLEVQLNKKNDTTSLMDVTTEHFKIYDKTSEQFLSDTDVKKIFPPNQITKEYILICKLKPTFSDTIHGEEISCKSTLSISNASNLGCYNVAHTCMYRFNKDVARQEATWEEKKSTIITETDSEAIIANKRKNWMLGEGTKITIPNSFKFTLETLGVYSNLDIVNTAISILINQFQMFIETTNYTITRTSTIMKNGFDIEIEQDYSFGYIIQYMMLGNFGEREKLLSYVGFKKIHPHDKTSVLKVAFISDDSNEETLISLIRRCCELTIVELNNLNSQFV